ncbi:MAG: Ig-like domain-containing protein [Sinimarinibacterium flocculans]|uniref:Ig-like domain-containing protein n=1 Tax=Sinimarinibacterium flocculans TaxID=985250 RepID=UPI003C318AD6
MRIASLLSLLPRSTSRAAPVSILIAALLVAACGGDGSLRSPDLPPLRLIGIGQLACTYPNGGSSIAVGQTANCQVVGGCTFRRVNEDGSTSQVVGACPDDLTFSSNRPNIAPVDADTGVVTGVSPGTTDITAGSGDVESNPVTVTVNNACGEDFAVTPAATTLISGPTTGTSQLFTAIVTFSDGTTLDVSTSGNTAWASSNESVVTFSSNQATAVPGLSAQASATATATYSGNVCTGGTLTDTAAITVNPSQIGGGASGICIETVPPAGVFTGCRADTGACLTPGEAIELAAGETRQLQIRGRFDNGEECNITSDTTLSIGAGGEGIATVDELGVLTGVGAGDTAVNAEFDGITASRPVEVVVNQVLGRNSLQVFARSGFQETDTITLADAQNLKFACVGANDLVSTGLGDGSRQPRGFLKAFAFAARCDSTALDEDGNCTAVPAPPDGEDPPAEPLEPSPEAFLAQALPQNVSNLPPKSTEPGSDPLDDGIHWESVAGYWAVNPATEEFECIQEASNPSANAGDLYVEGERVIALDEGGMPIEPEADGETGEVDLGALQANGVVYSDALVRVGFNCVTATYENPENPAETVTNGMTVLVLPVTNDILFDGSNDGNALCESLAPLFGSESLLGLVEVTNVLSSVTSSLSPLLEGLDPVTGTLDGLVTTLLNGLELITEPLIDLLDGILIDPVVDPLACQLTNAVDGLLGLLTGNPSIPQECSDFGGDVPAP